jgi:hypothetical protein
MRLAALVLAAAGLSAASYGSTITFSASGSHAATADFDFSANLLTLTLTNDTVNPADAGFLLTGIQFVLSSGTFGNNIGSQTNVTGTERTLTGTGINQWTDSPYSSSTTYWNFTNTGTTFNLLFNGPSHGIIGDPGASPAYSKRESQHRQ